MGFIMDGLDAEAYDRAVLATASWSRRILGLLPARSCAHR